MAGYQPRHDTDPVWFNGTKINHLDITSTGVGVRVTGVFGWDDRPDVRDVRELRSGQDGEYADNLFIGGRTITLEGEVYGSSWVNLQARKRTLAALFIPSSNEVLLKIPDPATASPTTSYSTTGMTGYERLSCRVIEGIEFGDSLEPMCQTWQVVLRASDPRVYSDTETSTDSGTSGTAARTVTVDQGGTYETPVTLTVTGPSGPSHFIVEPDSGLQLEISGPQVLAGETLSIDVLDRLIEANLSYENSRLNFIEGGASIVALWMMDETVGTTADNAEGTSARDGTYTGGFTLNQAGPVSGTSSVALNGTTGYVSIPNVAALYADPIIYEQWFKLDTVSGTQTLVDGITSNKGFMIDVLGGEIRLTHRDISGANETYTVGAGLAISTWYRVVAILNRSTGPGPRQIIQVYDAGGALITQREESGSTLFLPATAGGYRIGCTLAGANFLDGNVGPCSIFSVPVNGYVSSPESALQAYQYLSAASAVWANLGTGSTTYYLESDDLNTGSKLTVAYRDARL